MKSFILSTKLFSWHGLILKESQNNLYLMQRFSLKCFIKVVTYIFIKRKEKKYSPINFPTDEYCAWIFERLYLNIL